MPYEIVRLDDARKPGAVDALCGAFYDDPVFTYIAPDAGQRVRWMPYVMQEDIGLIGDAVHSHVALAEGGQVAGVVLAGTYLPTRLEDILINLRLILKPRPWVPNLRHLRKIYRYTDVWEKAHYKGPHVYVYMLGVHPDHQRQGLGRRMMQAVIELAAGEDKLPVYLETVTESNVQFYKSLGMEVTSEDHPDPEGPRTWGMLLRNPAIPSSSFS